jgi:WhiB family redox-sensing transcriptional regulator
VRTPYDPEVTRYKDRDWRADAECLGVHVNVFYPRQKKDTREAREFCGVCPVTRECLTFALSSRDRFGVFGGTSWPQRRRMLKERSSS